MPRNGSGVYALPSGSTVSNGDVSDATDINVPLADLEAEANLARPIVAGGTGATSAADARTNLGATATGSALFTAADAGAARTALGATATGSALLTASGATAARATLAAMPVIQSGAGVGQILTLDAANGASLSLPGTGVQTYAYWYVPQTVSGGALGTSAVGVSPGGTLLNSGAAGVILRGFCIRLT